MVALIAELHPHSSWVQASETEVVWRIRAEHPELVLVYPSWDMVSVLWTTYARQPGALRVVASDAVYMIVLTAKEVSFQNEATFLVKLGEAVTSLEKGVQDDICLGVDF